MWTGSTPTATAPPTGERWPTSSASTPTMHGGGITGCPSPTRPSLPRAWSSASYWMAPPRRDSSSIPLTTSRQSAITVPTVRSRTPTAASWRSRSRRTAGASDATAPSTLPSSRAGHSSSTARWTGAAGTPGGTVSRSRRLVAIVAVGLAVFAAAVLPAGAAPPAARERDTTQTPASGAPVGRPVADIVKEADAAFAREDFKQAKVLYEEADRLAHGYVRDLHRLALLT